MAELNNTQFARVVEWGVTDRFAVYVLRGVTTGDTMDLSADFKRIIKATSLATTANAYDKMAATPVGGAILTIPTGWANDAGWLTVYGVTAQ